MTLVVKNLPATAGDARSVGSVLRSGRSPGGGDGNLFLYSCLKIPWAEEPGRLLCHLGSPNMLDSATPWTVAWKAVPQFKIKKFFKRKYSDCV